MVPVLTRAPNCRLATSYALATDFGVIHPSEGHHNVAFTSEKSMSGQRR
jgi:hypothetical protein